MKQEDINDLLSNRPSSQFADKAITAMKKAVEWLEDDRAGDDYISEVTEEWYWEMKDLLKGAI